MEDSYVARDKNGELYLFIGNYPIRDGSEWLVKKPDGGVDTQCVRLDDSMFPLLTWEDEPQKADIFMVNPFHQCKCKTCGHEFRYRKSDIKYYGDGQPASSYIDDEYPAVVCPECGNLVYV